MWKSVVGWETSHEVSDDGRARSVTRTLTLSDGRVRTFPSCELAQYADGFGYRKVTLKAQGKTPLRVHVHVLVAAAWYGPRPPGAHVCHSDGDHLNNTPENLRYDTPAGNNRDTKKHGRLRPKRKLSDEAVAAIRAARGTTPGAELAERYGTSKAHVCNIQRGNRRTL